LKTAQIETSHKKSLGQFFSGPLIAKLLAELARHNSASTILDPMNGTGDMLLACQANSRISKEYFGIEIDKQVFKNSKKRFSHPKTNLYQGNAFSKNIIEYISKIQYDLIITNPPYVRYQTISKNKNAIPEFLSTTEIKSNLITSLLHLEHLDKEDQKFFEILISNYSGLADLAVPSWILCALNAKVNGRIALVVPEAWLNRNYAGVIQYILLRWFKIEYIVEDGNSTWFQDAQVKTTLIVAKRIKRKSSIYSWKNEFFINSLVYSDAKNSKSLLGSAFPKSLNPEMRFKRSIDKGISIEGKFSVDRVSLANFAQDVIRGIEHSKWFKLLEPKNKENTTSGNALKAQSKLRNWMNEANTNLLSLKDYGVEVSQGLRTGANSFFYLDIVKKSRLGVLAQPSKELNSNNLFIPNHYFKYTVSRQAELDDSFSTNKFTAKRILLYLQNGISQSDLAKYQKFNFKVPIPYKELSTDISEHIEQVENLNIGSIKDPKFVPELSAVAPNNRPWNKSKPSVPPRFWYMLPDLSKRHLPELFIPRVNGNYPKTRINENDKYVIDANFSTLWLIKESPEINKWTLLALLNSTWCKVSMEEHGTVMGGGALKLEATQIKRLPIPNISKKRLLELSRLGNLLPSANGNTAHVLKQIDEIVIQSLGFKDQINKKQKELSKILELALNKRAKRK